MVPGRPRVGFKLRLKDDVTGSDNRNMPALAAHRPMSRLLGDVGTHPKRRENDEEDDADLRRENGMGLLPSPDTRADLLDPAVPRSSSEPEAGHDSELRGAAAGPIHCAVHSSYNSFRIALTCVAAA